MVSLGLTVGRNTPNSLDSPIQVHSTGGRLSTWPPHKGACALARKLLGSKASCKQIRGLAG